MTTTALNVRIASKAKAECIFAEAADLFIIVASRTKKSTGPNRTLLCVRLLLKHDKYVTICFFNKFNVF